MQMYMAGSTECVTIANKARKRFGNTFSRPLAPPLEQANDCDLVSCDYLACRDRTLPEPSAAA